MSEGVLFCQRIASKNVDLRQKKPINGNSESAEERLTCLRIYAQKNNIKNIDFAQEECREYLNKDELAKGLNLNQTQPMKTTLVASPASGPEGGGWLTKRELAKILGFTVRGIDKLMQERKISWYEFGPRRVRFRLPEVVACLDRLRVRGVGD